MRLIDADALIQAADKMFEHITSPISNYVTTYDVYSLINNAPTVERMPHAIVKFDKDELDRIVDERIIKPIKNGELVIKEEKPKGEWIFIDNDIGWDKCSNCDWTDARCHSWNFCPNCGADMRKVVQNERSR